MTPPCTSVLCINFRLAFISPRHPRFFRCPTNGIPLHDFLHQVALFDVIKNHAFHFAADRLAFVYLKFKTDWCKGHSVYILYNEHGWCMTWLIIVQHCLLGAFFSNCAYGETTTFYDLKFIIFDSDIIYGDP